MGHHRRRAALYRRPLEGGAVFEPAVATQPVSTLSENHSGRPAVHRSTVAIGTEDGCVFISNDAGRRWESITKGLAPVRAVALSWRAG